MDQLTAEQKTHHKLRQALGVKHLRIDDATNGGVFRLYRRTPLSWIRTRVRR